jgi:hypothetical protein
MLREFLDALFGASVEAQPVSIPRREVLRRPMEATATSRKDLDYQKAVYEQRAGALESGYHLFLRDGNEADLISWDELARGDGHIEGIASPNAADIINDWERFNQIDVRGVEQEFVREVLRDYVTTFVTGGNDTQFWEVMTRIAVRHNDRDAPRMTPQEARSWAAKNWGSEDVASLCRMQWNIDLSDIKEEVSTEQTTELTEALSSSLLEESDWTFLRELALLRGLVERLDDPTDAELREWAEQKYGTSDVREIARQCGVDVADAEREFLVRRAESLRREAQEREYLRRRRKAGDPLREVPVVDYVKQDRPWYSEQTATAADDDQRLAELMEARQEAEINLRRAAEEALALEVEWPLTDETFRMIDVDRTRAFANHEIAILCELSLRRLWQLGGPGTADSARRINGDFYEWLKIILENRLREDPTLREWELKRALDEMQLWMGGSL